MRDIRGDLQDRASLLEEQISSHEAQFDKLIEQLKLEHDARLEDLKAELEAVNRLLEVELRRLGTAPASPKTPSREPVHHAVHQPVQHAGAHQPPQHVAHQPPHHAAHQPAQHASHRPQAQAQPQPELPLADFLVRKLNEVGAMSRDDLRRLALQEGYFVDADTADRGVHASLLNVVKAGLIRQLPNGNFAPATVLDTIRLRRAM
ncbi:MAG TPA: hypothetical protein VHK26_07425 [Methyloceanibacter sp.]|nr:hypothetical protein [Methyloceanibacter sp.]